MTAENPYLQIVIVAGNHDSAARLEAPLPLLQAMRTEVRGVVRKLEGGEIDYDHLTVELKNRRGEVELLCMAVPFLRQGDYPAVQTEGNPYAEGVRELYAQLCKGYGSEGRRIRRFLPSVICRLQDRRLQKKIIVNVL